MTRPTGNEKHGLPHPFIDVSGTFEKDASISTDTGTIAFENTSGRIFSNGSATPSKNGTSRNDREYLNLKQVTELYPFTKGQLRHYLLYRHKNGLSAAVHKIGRRIYLKRQELNAWIESQNGDGGHV